MSFHEENFEQTFFKLALKVKMESTSFHFSLHCVATGESSGKQDKRNNGKMVSGNTVRNGSSVFF